MNRATRSRWRVDAFARATKGRTTQELAELFACDASSVNKWRRGFTPQIRMLLSWCRELGRRPGYFFERVPETDPLPADSLPAAS